MKFATTNDGAALNVASTGNCDTDSSALVPQVFFRNFRGAYDPECGAIASSVLFSRYCGAVAEFDNVKLGIDAARAVRTIAPDVEEIMPIDGAKREIGQGTATLVVGEAERLFDGRMRPGATGRSARAITWSGDFLAHGARNSTNAIGGDIFTNGLMVAASTQISVALALLIGGRSLRDIYVPEPANDERTAFDRIAEGLAFMSIKLRAI